MGMMVPGEWGLDNLPGARRAGRSIVSECPFCGKTDHFYLHAEKGYWICYSGKCAVRGRDLVNLVAKVEGITISEALRIVRQGGDGKARRVHEADGPASGAVNTPLPKTMKPIWDGKVWRMPRYLLRRGMTPQFAHRYGLGYCDNGLCDEAPGYCYFPENVRTCIQLGNCRYAMRVILPIECPGGRSFTARSVVAGEELRYLNPPTPKGKLLFGWRSITKYCDVTLCEGPFDALRIIDSGYPALAIMGLFLSSDQREMLEGLRPTSITIMLDPGTTNHAITIARAVYHIAPVFIARLQGGLDPGDTPHETIGEIFRSAKQFKSSLSDVASMNTGEIRRLSNEIL